MVSSAQSRSDTIIQISNFTQNDEKRTYLSFVWNDMKTRLLYIDNSTRGNHAVLFYFSDKGLFAFSQHEYAASVF
jgi:hypothetical protein